LQGFQRELNRIYRPKFDRYWSKTKDFAHVLTGICPEKIFRPFFLNVRRKTFSTSPRSPTLLGKIVAKKKFLQGIIGFRRAILADTPLIKRG
jgi:hypothetical protein